MEVRLKETHYNSDWNLDIDFLNFFLMNSLPAVQPGEGAVMYANRFGLVQASR